MIAYNVVGVGRFQSVVPAKEVVKDTDLILRSLRSKRLEGWTQRADSRPSFETRAPDSANALPGARAPQDEVRDIFTISLAGTTMVIGTVLASLPSAQRDGHAHRQPINPERRCASSFNCFQFSRACCLPSRRARKSGRRG